MLRRLRKRLASSVPAGGGPRSHRERRRRRPERKRRRKHPGRVGFLGGMTPYDAPEFHDGKPDGD